MLVSKKEKKKHSFNSRKLKRKCNDSHSELIKDNFQIPIFADVVFVSHKSITVITLPFRDLAASL